jgi:hypothetical protein
VSEPIYPPSLDTLETRLERIEAMVADVQDDVKLIADTLERLIQTHATVLEMMSRVVRQ